MLRSPIARISARPAGRASPAEQEHFLDTARAQRLERVRRHVGLHELLGRAHDETLVVTFNDAPIDQQFH
mgnify:CR=1 FL=1